MDSPKLPYSLFASSSTPLDSSAVKPHRNKRLCRNCILIIIAVSCILLLLTLLIYSTVSKSSRNHHNSANQSSTSDHPPPETPLPPPPISQIRLACNATRFPDHCITSLSKPGQVPPDPEPVSNNSLCNLRLLRASQIQPREIKSILDSSTGNKNRTNIANICLEILSYAKHRTESTDSPWQATKSKMLSNRFSLPVRLLVRSQNRQRHNKSSTRSRFSKIS